MVNPVYILGGGVTGLALAYELLKRGQSVEVIEKSSSVGGLAKTIEWKGRAIDMGPHIYHTPDKDIQEYWESEFEGLFYERDHWAKNLKNGQFYDYPISREFINSLPTELKDKISHDLENTDPEALARASNYYEYTLALAGETLQELFFTHYPQKLWGMSTKDLDANWAPKRVQITEERRAFYQGQWSAVGINGSGTIIANLAEKVLSLGGIISLGESVEKVKCNAADRIEQIVTDKRTIEIRPRDLVINTTSCTVFSSLIGLETSLKYRGVILVLLELNTARVFPEGVDFVYVDDQNIFFNRVSDQNSFIAEPKKESTVICCEITYSPNDNYDLMNSDALAAEVKRQFCSLDFCEFENILDHKVVKLSEVYPMYFKGYQSELNNTKESFDKLSNLYTLGSLAEFAYADLQILFSKAIDLAQVITDKTFKINKINKTTPRIAFNKLVRIGSKLVGENQGTFVIAEIGLNHNGNIKVAKELIDAAIIAGADAVKLQTYKAENRVAQFGKTSRYVEKVLGTEETDYEMLKKSELTPEQTKELFDYARGRTIVFSAPFDLESVEELEKLNVDCYKIASFDLVNLPLLRAVAETNKPMIVSTGMSYLSEVQDALIEIISVGNQNLMLMQCTSSYPCPPENMNIRAIDTMKTAFGGLPVGLSDHVIGDSVSLAAVARGADLIEKHFTLDKDMEGPDHVLSLLPEEMENMIKGIRLIECALGDGIKQPAANEIASVIRFRKTMYSSRSISKGEVICADHIMYTGPAYGLYAKYEDMVIGQIAQRDLPENMPITWDLVSQDLS
ncbi:FAD-dependent oxidoreductase [Gammaproteobacteria bacterium]|nr:FAD-dependent oxidoreductase [Gammaproteobacteria bacterium]